MGNMETAELTIVGLCWAQPKDTAQVEEALGGGQEAHGKDETPEMQHLLTWHLWRDPHQPKHQSHPLGTSSLGASLALHPSHVLLPGSGAGPPGTYSPQGPAQTHSTLFPPRKVKLLLVLRQPLKNGAELLCIVHAHGLPLCRAGA